MQQKKGCDETEYLFASCVGICYTVKGVKGIRDRNRTGEGMQDNVQQILEDKFEYVSGSLDFSCDRIELFLQPGECCEGSFSIASMGSGYTCGQVISSDIRMECLTKEFSGSGEEITFCFHGEQLQSGAVVKGSFYIISNQGEYDLPFSVTISDNMPESSLGPLKNLFHFVNLAKTSWEEAVSLFYSPNFIKLLQGNDRQYYPLYMALSSCEGNPQNVDQFLTAIRKKQPLEYLVTETGLELENPTGVAELEISLTRNGWGASCLQVAVEGEFLFTEKERITDDDFIGSICRLPVFIDSGMLHAGRNLGSVILFDTEHTLTVPVTVHCRRGIAVESSRERKRIFVQLMEYYQAMRLKQISTSTWLKESDKLVEALAAMDEQDVAARLFQAQLMITKKRYHEAQWLLDHARDLLEEETGIYETDPAVLEAYYLYLTTLVEQDETYIRRVTDRIRQIYYEQPGQWRVAWLLLYLSEEYDRTPGGKWMFLEKQSSYGCSSPVIYIEALNLLNMNPSLLRRLGEFELQVLAYGNKKTALSQELLEQLYYLAERVREYSPQLFGILRSCYEKQPEKRILKEICTLLIKGNKVSAEAFTWYQRGVEAELRITKLYEYYMMALDMDEEVALPKMVLLYFSYQNNLDHVHSAYLYRYLVEHREEYEELYAAYHQQMELFVMEQLQKGRMSRDLAALYRELLTDAMIGEQTAEPLSRMIFAHEVRISHPGIRNVIVYQPGNLLETVYPVGDERTWIALYGKDCLVLLEDDKGCRYAQNIPHTIEKLMTPGRYIRKVAGLVENSPQLDLYLYNSGELLEESKEQQEARWLRIWHCETLEPSVRREVCLRLMKSYYEADQMQKLADFLQNLPAELLEEQERQEAVRYMVIVGNYELAYQWLCDFGLYELDSKIMVYLVGQMIRKQQYMKDEQLLQLATLIFRNRKYDGTILRYLCLHYQGMLREMRSIWKAARSFEVDCYELSERVLVQQLLSGSYVGEQEEIFGYYVTQGPKTDIESAYLAQNAYDYYVKDKPVQEVVLREILHLHQQKESLQLVCMLAFIKYYAANQQAVTEDIWQTARDFIRMLLEKGIHLKDFFAYRGLERELSSISDRTIIEYHGHPDSVVRIHYLLSSENSDEDIYVTEDMQPVYGGVFVKEFVLFFGESLQYYIVEERGRVEQLTESGKLQRDDRHSSEPGGRFGLVDRMVISRSLQDYETLEQMLGEFYRTEFLGRQLIKLR